MYNEKERVYSLTVTLEVRVVATSEEFAVEHVNQVLNDTCPKTPEMVGAIEIAEWDVI